VVGLLVGIVLFYAPFALIVRLVGLFQPTTAAGTATADVHAACLRMSIGWVALPWMWPTLGASWLTLLPLVVLPLAAVLAGPLFCGWICPAGAIPEYLGRLVPDRFKFDFKDRVSITALRYGLFTGFMLAPFVSGAVSCAFCNFGQTQNFISALAGDFSALSYITSMGVITLVLWAVVLGVFTKGGRGWCMFLCPAGALSGLASGLTHRFGKLWRVRAKDDACSSCGTCEQVCAMRAITCGEESGPEIDHFLCNSCMDCVKACPTKCLTYGPKR
jgi:ferredoxin-type protein NapH